MDEAEALEDVLTLTGSIDGGGFGPLGEAAEDGEVERARNGGVCGGGL